MLCPNCRNLDPLENDLCPVCGFFMFGLPDGSLLNNRYEILNSIKAGGMGVIYRAFDRSTGKICAVKELFRRDDLQEDVETYMINRFMEEASLLAELNHPCIPEIIDYFIMGKDNYNLIMDYKRVRIFLQLSWIMEEKA